METDAQGIRKKSFYTEEEDIDVKPSPELIPDEYEHMHHDVLFHIFRNIAPPEVEFSECLLETFKNIGYGVDIKKNLHPLATISQFKEDLKAIKNEAQSKSALILVFFGYFGKDDGTLFMLDEPKESSSFQVKNVWNMFSSNNCPELKYKPKIFIFCTSPKPVVKIQTDSKLHRSMNYDDVYDFPAESDMLIVYKKINDPWSPSMNIFVDELCANILKYSKQYDIIDLVSYIHKQKTVPLLISTLTRKFYLTPNADREHLLSIAENRNLLEETLKKIQDDVQKLHETQKKKKMFSFSFRKKPEDKPKIVKKEKSEVKVPSTSSSHRSPRTSSTSVPERRSRQASESDSAATKNKQKPNWKI